MRRKVKFLSGWWKICNRKCMLYSLVLLTKYMYQIFRICFQATLKENVMKGPDFGKIHLKFLRFDLEFVGIQINIWNILYSILIFRMFRFWFKMVLSENCVFRAWMSMNVFIVCVKTLRNTVVIHLVHTSF